MKNKYQEALDNLKQYSLYHYALINEFEVLQELIDKYKELEKRP